VKFPGNNLWSPESRGRHQDDEWGTQNKVHWHDSFKLHSLHKACFKAAV